MNMLLLNWFYADKARKDLEAQGAEVPGNFVSKSLLYGMAMPSNPAMGLVLTHLEKNKIASTISSEGSGGSSNGESAAKSFLNGKVFDDRGNLVPGAMVTFINKEIDEVNEAVMNEIGETSNDVDLCNKAGVFDLTPPPTGEFTLIAVKVIHKIPSVRAKASEEQSAARWRYGLLKSSDMDGDSAEITLDKII